MLGSSGGLIASSGEGGGGGGGGDAVVGNSSSIMSGGIGDEENKVGGEGGSEFFEGDRSTGGNRWPRQETLALLKIRSDMDAVFRDSSLKSPLWEEVSRKMAELGYHRSSKKCKEKFENVYKYHKRTKDGRVGKSDGKTYRFFDQLEALEQHQLSLTSSLPPLPPATPRAQVQMPAQAAIPVSMVFPASVTVTSTSPHPSMSPQQHHQSPPVNVTAQAVHQQHHNNHSSPIQMENVSSYPSDTPSSSSTSSDEELLGRRKRKRKWKDFFERLMKEVIDKQEQLQTRFLEAVEKREHDRLVKEEVWKSQEMGRLNREHEILIQERSMAAAKDAALIDLLKKLSDHHHIPMPFSVDAVQTQTQTQTQTAAVANAVAITTQLQPPPPPPPIQAPVPPPPQPQPVLQPRPVPVPQPQPQPQPQVAAQVHVQDFPVSLAMPVSIQPQPQPQPQPVIQGPLQVAQQQALVIANTNVNNHESNNGKENHQHASSSRWPKAEVQALINLRTKLDEKYQENGPKGPLWEEISTSMKELGYNRNSKRCKEKWENINKYFKKVKESKKKRPEDSKTCPYFHQLDALYRRKATYNPTTDATTYVVTTKPENLNTMGPIMAQPDQHWHTGSGNDSDDDGDDDDDDDQGNGYEIVANNSNNNNNNNGGNATATTTTTTTTTAQ